MEKIDQILDSIYDRVIEPVEAKEQLLLLFDVSGSDMEKIDQILDSIYDRVIEPVEAKEQLFFDALEYAYDNWSETLNYMTEDEIEQITDYENKEEVDGYLRCFYERT